MSALVAIAHRDGAPVDPEAVRRALDAQGARGPDARRCWIQGPIAIGHALLATTVEDDLARQPLVADAEGAAIEARFDERGARRGLDAIEGRIDDGDGLAGSAAIVAAIDGRIDNREELAEALRIGAAAPDVAIVARAYARWGDAFAARLLGDFAIVIWDGRRRELVCARDPLSARPLYVRDDGRTIVVASIAEAIAVATGEPRAPSFEAMALFLVERFVERGGTLLRGIEAIAPGSVVCVPVGADGRSPNVRRRVVPPAWPAAVAPRARRTLDDHAAELREALREAVRCRMRARDRLAVHVSGGLDSSSIAALAVEVARARGDAPPLLIRCVFPGLACDETRESDAVAAHLGLPIESVEMPGHLGDFAPREDGLAPPIAGASAPREDGLAPPNVRAFGGAAAYENPIAMMLVRMTGRARALGARVTLTGAGSDQLLLPTGLELPGALRRGDARAALEFSGVLASPMSARPYARLLREGVFRLLPAAWRDALRGRKRRRDELPSWLTERARRALVDAAGDPPPALSREAFRTEAVRELVARIAHHADYAYSLVLADRIAGARGGEMRHPFFDRRVIDLVLSFPDEIRAAGPPKKRLLRRAMGASLPDAVRDRPSAAEFSPLVRAALVEPHGERLASLLRRGRLVAEGLVDPAEAALAITRARTDDEAVREVLSLAWLEAWLRSNATRP